MKYVALRVESYVPINMPLHDIGPGSEVLKNSHLFMHCIITESLLCTRHCARPSGRERERDSSGVGRACSEVQISEGKYK